MRPYYNFRQNTYSIITLKAQSSPNIKCTILFVHYAIVILFTTLLNNTCREYLNGIRFKNMA